MLGLSLEVICQSLGWKGFNLLVGMLITPYGKAIVNNAAKLLCFQTNLNIIFYSLIKQIWRYLYIARLFLIFFGL